MMSKDPPPLSPPRIGANRFERPPLHRRAVACTFSAGVTLIRPDDATIDACMLRADGALYRAKATGRNRVEREG
jgi:PleD family two-component response regulator